MSLSVVIPCRNEASCLKETLYALRSALKGYGTDFEIIVVNDHSDDSTSEVLAALSYECPQIRAITNLKPPGFGFAVRTGIEAVTKETVAIYMADGSDFPADLIRFHKTLLEKNVDCVFGSRFLPGSRVIDYPLHKLVLNRIINTLIRILFGLHYNDVTNAFKLYKKETLGNLVPFLSCHFNLTVELPLKAIIRGHSYAVVPNSWANRAEGVSKLKIREMGSRYLFIILYCFIEKWLSRGDYHRAYLETNRNTV